MSLSKIEMWRAHVQTCEREQQELIHFRDSELLAEARCPGEIANRARDIEGLNQGIASLGEEIALRFPQTRWRFYRQ
jgi:hypothetical protein